MKTVFIGESMNRPYCGLLFVLCFETKNIRILAGMITTNGQADRFKIQPMYALAIVSLILK